MENYMEIDDDKLSTLRKDTKKLGISERQEKIITEVIIWFTRDDSLGDREGLLEWFFDGNIVEGTEYQLKIERQLLEFLPALFENHDDNSTFADKNNRTPLHCCILKMGHYCNDKPAGYELVSALCDLGMSILALDCDGRSPLGMALSMGRMDVVEVLIRYGSKNVAGCNNRGQSALHILIKKYYHESKEYKKYQVLVLELLRKGADVNQPDRNGVTPVHLAAGKLDIELIQELMMNGANLNCRTSSGNDLLMFVCKNRNDYYCDERKMLELIDWLVDIPDFCVNGKNVHGFTALNYAAKCEDIEIVKRLIRAGADVHAVANDDTNVLHWAAVSPHSEVMQHLIELGVDFRRRDNVYGFSLLHMAALSGNPRKCEWLVKEKGFDVDDLGKCQMTPLHVASSLGLAKVVGKLIELGADVHRTNDKFHYSALHVASMRGRFTTIRVIRNNAEEFRKEIYKLCLFSFEEINEDQWSFVKVCLNHCLFVLDIEYNATVVALLVAGAEVNVRDNNGCTPLHHATRQSVEGDVVRVLLKAGAHVDVQDKESSTPLQNSFVNNNFIGLISVLTFGANINDLAHLNDEIYREMTEGYPVARAIVEHLLKLKIAGLPIDESYKRSVDNFQSEYLQRQTDCLLELTKMKKRMLTDEASLYDVLHMNFKRRSSFANSLPHDIEIEFPNYSVILEGRCNEAVNRMALFEPAIEAFDRITGMQWPIVCIDNIFSFVSNLSLRVLIDAASVTES